MIKTDYEDKKPLIDDNETERSTDKLARKKLSLLHAAQYCIIFIVLDVAKQIFTYSIKYYNQGLYPIPQTQIVAWIEAIKLLFSAVIYIYITHKHGSKSRFRLSFAFALPALIYSLNNNVYLAALNYTTPPIWLMLIQSRVFLTAIVYRFLFHKLISRMQWFALGLLVASLCTLTLMNSEPTVSTKLSSNSGYKDNISAIPSSVPQLNNPNDISQTITDKGIKLPPLQAFNAPEKIENQRKRREIDQKHYISPMPPSFNPIYDEDDDNGNNNNLPETLTVNVEKRSETDEKTQNENLKEQSKPKKGLSMTAFILSLISASMSVTASIITEYLFKNDKRSFMEQQVQMYAFSFVLSVILCSFQPNALSNMFRLQISPQAPVGTGSILTLLFWTLALGALGGLAVAVIVKNLDNIVKIYCASLGNMGTAIVSWFMFPDRFTLDGYYVASLALLFAAIYMYEQKKPITGAGNNVHHSKNSDAFFNAHGGKNGHEKVLLAKNDSLEDETTDLSALGRGTYKNDNDEEREYSLYNAAELKRLHNNISNNNNGKI